MKLTYQPYRGKTVVFCLPGSYYSGRFLVSFCELLEDCRKEGMTTVISQNYSSMVNFARCKVAGADVQKGKKQVPFSGRVPYDYMMWIDSDIVFTSRDFFKLINLKKDIAAGWYTQPGGYSPVVEKMEEDYFQKNGHFAFIHKDAMAQRTKIFEADYIGFGWTLIKKGVFENLPYPWFAPKRMSIGPYEDMCSEDVAFCIDARDKGYSIWVDPTIKVGHEKIQVL